MGIMSHDDDQRYVLGKDRDVVAELVKSMRQAYKNGWEFAKVPTWVLREVHDKMTHANTEDRFSDEHIAAIMKRIMRK